MYLYLLKTRNLKVILSKETPSEADYLYTSDYALGIRFMKSIRFYNYFLEFSLIFWSLIIEIDLWSLSGKKRYMRETIKKTQGAFKDAKLDTKLYTKYKKE